MAFYCIPRRRRHHRTNPAKREGNEGSLIKKGERSGGSPRGKGVTHGICRRYRNRGRSGGRPGGGGARGGAGGGGGGAAGPGSAMPVERPKTLPITIWATMPNRSRSCTTRPGYPTRNCWKSSGQATIPPNALGADNTCPGSSTTTTNRRVWRNARGTGKHAGSGGGPPRDG